MKLSSNKQIVFLGFDTSCYTTSVAMVDIDRNAAWARELLPVKQGARGLAQSEMVFLHTRKLPELVASMSLADCDIRAIGVSTKPRDCEDSYMPAFLVGKAVAQSLGCVLGKPVYELSHQTNHLYAALSSADMPDMHKFLFVHISGGTTEVLLAEKTGRDYIYKRLMQTLDISAGQFIDRIGVKLGLSFPAGVGVEALAIGATDTIELPVAVRKGCISFAGPCSAAERLLHKPCDNAAMAKGVLDCVAESLYRSVRYWAASQSVNRVLFIGGVAGNSLIQGQLREKLNKYRVQAFFATPQYSSDNAIGSALYARLRWLEENG